MKVGPYEYKNIKRLKVVYPELDDKPEYRKPILCRARDMGEVIYGKWIIGGEQGNGLTGEVYADDEKKFYTAYKLVGEAEIICNFELEDRNIPFTIFVRFTDSAVCRSPQEQEVERLYYVDAAMNSYHPCCSEPEIDATDNGVIYIKMPSGAETKSADGAAEEKFTGRPQIQVGDVVRIKECCFVVSNVVWNGVLVDSDSTLYAFPQITAIYRFDGRDFKLIWESVEYKLDRFEKIIDEINKMQLTLSVKLKSVTEAFARYTKEAGDDKHGSEEKN